MELLISINPGLLSSEKITWISYLGASVVVAGTVIFVIKNTKSAQY
jgi:hypothetical protein